MSQFLICKQKLLRFGPAWALYDHHRLAQRAIPLEEPRLGCLGMAQLVPDLRPSCRGYWCSFGTRFAWLWSAPATVTASQ